ncbi:type II toxin-antitoxin system death-on-curing family toxin [Candidatus Parcubacteria bacterium]|nr:MAG: type II toxin-antitoxin system death-on-curing family toxin [Candidatus Parcubacteria bacterium]
MGKPSRDSHPHEGNFLTSEDFKFLCFEMAVEFMTYEEPIPDYNTRNNSLLESALASPKQTFGGQLLYPTLTLQASILFYSLIKNHPFLNGNKRIAVMSLLSFLSINKKWIQVRPYDLYNFACKTSESLSKDKDKVLKEIEKFIRENLEAAEE